MSLNRHIGEASSSRKGKRRRAQASASAARAEADAPRQMREAIEKASSSSSPDLPRPPGRLGGKGVQFRPRALLFKALAVLFCPSATPGPRLALRGSRGCALLRATQSLQCVRRLFVQLIGQRGISSSSIFLLVQSKRRAGAFVRLDLLRVSFQPTSFGRSPSKWRIRRSLIPPG